MNKNVESSLDKLVLSTNWLYQMSMPVSDPEKKKFVGSEQEFSSASYAASTWIMTTRVIPATTSKISGFFMM